MYQARPQWSLTSMASEIHLSAIWVSVVRFSVSVQTLRVWWAETLRVARVFRVIV